MYPSPPRKDPDGRMAPEKSQVATGPLKGSHGPSKGQMATWPFKEPYGHMALARAWEPHGFSQGQVST